MKVFILPKMRFDGLMEHKGITNGNVTEYKNNFFISINDPEDIDDMNPYFQNHENVKVIHFPDLEEDLKEGKHDLTAFTKDQAKDLFEFIMKHKDKQALIVHCAAGVSRSGAVGRFVHEYFQGDEKEFRLRNPHIHPNGRVLSMLRQAAQEYESKN